MTSSKSGPPGSSGGISGSIAGDLEPCGACGRSVAPRALFCHACGAAQPPRPLDPFTRLGLERRFDIDLRPVGEAACRLLPRHGPGALRRPRSAPGRPTPRRRPMRCMTPTRCCATRSAAPMRCSPLLGGTPVTRRRGRGDRRPRRPAGPGRRRAGTGSHRAGPGPAGRGLHKIPAAGLPQGAGHRLGRWQRAGRRRPHPGPAGTAGGDGCRCPRPAASPGPSRIPEPHPVTRRGRTVPAIGRHPGATPRSTPARATLEKTRTPCPR